ncbi:hypothetical protein AB0I84_45270 [Streptomyces spectabilis]|uniref:hypothetical protein n=1 Tax=Streptomyces spectabilis TaxID=68270 RepID=UPI0033F69271
MGDEELRRLEGDCIRLSEELDEARAANAELAREARDGAHWEGVADRMREEIVRLSELLRYEHNRANSAIDRETTAEEARDEVERRQERDRYRLAWLSARRRAADESVFGMEALALRDEEIHRLRARLEA